MGEQNPPVYFVVRGTDRHELDLEQAINMARQILIESPAEKVVRVVRVTHVVQRGVVPILIEEVE